MWWDNNEVSRDLLSTCPKLIDILRLIHYKDIPYTKLVSCRLYNTIQKHALLLARPSKCLHIVMDNEKVVEKDFVYIYSSKDFYSPALQIFITDGRLRVMDQPTWISNALQANGPLRKGLSMMEGTVAGDDEATLKELLGRRVYTTHQDFQINSLEEGLEHILSLLFRRYHFEELNLIKDFVIKEGDRAEAWITMIGQQFKQSLSRCNVLCLNDLKGFETLHHSTLGCGLSLTNGLMDVAYYLDTQRLDRALWIDVQPEQLPSLYPIVVLVKKWMTGDARILDLRISCKPDQQHFMRNRVVVQKLEPLHPVSSHTRDVDLNNGHIHFTFARTADHKHLHLIYSETRMFWIREVDTP